MADRVDPDNGWGQLMSAEGGGAQRPAEGASADTPAGANQGPIEGWTPPAKLRFETKGAKSRRRWPIRC